MHKLESPHILKFHDWYETRNNLWLILEYCTGADLESLLKQDGHLPEASVRMFGLDMIAALKVRLITTSKRQLSSDNSVI
jgi:serine/threonine-protein kinase ULK4